MTERKTLLVGSIPAEALASHIARIHETGGDQVLFQLEVPAELVFMTKAPGPVQQPLAGWLGGIVANLAAQAPAGTRFGVHLCLGDLGHKALGKLRDAGLPAPLAAWPHVRSWPRAFAGHRRTRAPRPLHLPPLGNCAPRII